MAGSILPATVGYQTIPARLGQNVAGGGLLNEPVCILRQQEALLDCLLSCCAHCRHVSLLISIPFFQGWSRILCREAQASIVCAGL
jgi:hypothetical protein